MVRDPAGTLPHADEEERVLRARFGSRLTVLAGPTATREAFLAAAPKADVLHLATHAVFRADRPEFSWLEMAEGRLYAADLIALELPRGPAVVMSACESARGDYETAGEMLGLQRAFLRAGASAVFAPLWPIEDQPAIGSFMEAFYGGIDAPLTCASARAAQQAAMRRGDPTSLWAAFTWCGA